jgi:hypothetical protein
VLRLDVASIQHNLVKHPLKCNDGIDFPDRAGSVLITGLTIAEMSRNIPKNICKLNGEASLSPWPEADLKITCLIDIH